MSSPKQTKKPVTAASPATPRRSKRQQQKHAKNSLSSSGKDKAVSPSPTGPSTDAASSSTMTSTNPVAHTDLSRSQPSGYNGHPPCLNPPIGSDAYNAMAYPPHVQMHHQILADLCVQSDELAAGLASASGILHRQQRHAIDPARAATSTAAPALSATPFPNPAVQALPVGRPVAPGGALHVVTPVAASSPFPLHGSVHGDANSVQYDRLINNLFPDDASGPPVANTGPPAANTRSRLVSPRLQAAFGDASVAGASAAIAPVTMSATPGEIVRTLAHTDLNRSVYVTAFLNQMVEEGGPMAAARDLVRENMGHMTAKLHAKLLLYRILHSNISAAVPNPQITELVVLQLIIYQHAVGDHAAEMASNMLPLPFLPSLPAHLIAAWRSQAKAAASAAGTTATSAGSSSK